MLIKQSNKHGSISDSELIGLKRQARVYKVILMKVVNVVSLFGLILMLYYYKNGIFNLLNEIRISYAALYKKITYIDEWFGDWCNKNIDSVEIDGLKYVNKQDIVSAMYKINDNNQIKIIGSISEMHDQILKIPLVKSAMLKRIVWQNKIVIDIKERDIFATVRTKLNDNLSLLDINGEIVNYYVENKFDNLPTIEDSDHPEKAIPLFLYLKEKKVSDYIYSFNMVSDRRWNIRFKNNLVIKLPSKDWKNAIDIMLHIDEKINLFSEKNTMSYIDLRIPGKIFLK